MPLLTAQEARYISSLNSSDSPLLIKIIAEITKQVQIKNGASFIEFTTEKTIPDEIVTQLTTLGYTYSYEESDRKHMISWK